MPNNLYPIFLKLEKLNGLIVGGGSTAYEKLFFMLKNSPQVNLQLVAKEIEPEIFDIISEYKANVEIIGGEYNFNYLKDKSFVIAATNDYDTNLRIVYDARLNNTLVNVADTPDLCDFYLGSVVTKDDLKIAISTNGKSPTFAKRVREFLEDLFPGETTELIENLHNIRNGLQGKEFKQKVQRLNELTSELLRQ